MVQLLRIRYLPAHFYCSGGGGVCVVVVTVFTSIHVHQLISVKLFNTWCLLHQKWIMAD